MTFTFIMEVILHNCCMTWYFHFISEEMMPLVRSYLPEFLADSVIEAAFKPPSISL